MRVCGAVVMIVVALAACSKSKSAEHAPTSAISGRGSGPPASSALALDAMADDATLTRVERFGAVFHLFDAYVTAGITAPQLAR